MGSTHPACTKGLTIRQRSPVSRGVAGRQLDRVSPEGAFGGHHGVEGSPFG
jgi:hypothetical protein